MNTVAMTHHSGIRLAEVGFLLIVIAGVWMVVAQAAGARFAAARSAGAGIALAVGGVLLIIATHWGHFA
jgi:hypothetical protein